MNAQQLKNSILQQAIQGKLVPQDPADEPASVLLQRIRKEKERLVKEGKLKKKDLESKPIEEDEIPFEIPESWEWVRLGNYANKVTDFVASGSFASLRENVKYYNNKEYAILVRTKDFQTDFQSDLVYTDKHGYDFLENSNLFGGELILPNIGASIGKVFIVPKLNYRMTLAPNTVMIRFVEDSQRDWVYLLFQSKFGKRLLYDISSSTAQGKFNKTDFKELAIPVPPLAEQRRIVAKIEELMPLVERYGKAQQALDQLNESLPARLRQSILQEAFFGNHVGIQISEINLVKLKDVCDIVMGQSPEGNTYNNSNGIEFHQGKVAFGKMYVNPSGVFTTCPTKYAEPDSIVVSVRAPVGTANITKRKICIGRGLACVKPKQNADLMFIYYLLESPGVREYLDDNSTGTTFKAISGKVLQELEVPLPPLSEQKRIVAKVEELFGVMG